MKSIILIAMSVVPVLMSATAQAYPLLSSFATTVNGRVLFYRDHENKDKYWYFSNVIDPVTNLDGSVSKPVIRSNRFYFAYSGQAQVRQADLQQFADTMHISPNDISAIPFEKTDSTMCMDVDGENVKIQIPLKVGSFLEHLPVTVTSKDPDSIDILKEAMTNGSGVNCSATVQYKVAADAHTIHYEVNMNQVYTEFAMEARARYWFVEVAIKTLLQKYARMGYIKLTEFKDGDMTQPPTTVDPNNTSRSTLDMFDQVFDLVIKEIFERKTKIPQGEALPAPGQGAAFGLRAGYVRSEEDFGFKGDYKMQGTRLHESQIQIRVAPLKE
ncbi:MAG: hypothetical protein JST80_09895 [Bdellovibrionales bacterium]|nr:hypothetical protein [Bdellovibrionales bacterium]